MYNYSHKQFGGVVKDVDTQKRRVTGYLTAYGNVDHDMDIGMKGMFAKTIAERGPAGNNSIFFLNQHNWQQPHGKFQELGEDDYGLKFVSEELPNTSYSNDAIKLYEAGIVKEHSYGYSVINSKWDDQIGANRLLEVKLYEGSNVTLGANPNTPFTGFKSLSVEDQFKEIDNRIASITKMLRHGTVTDDTMLQLEGMLKSLVRLSQELSPVSTQEPISDEITLEPEDIKAAFKNLIV